MIQLTDKQRLIWDEFSKDEFLRSNFYFTGGTALSGVYLHHRESEDLDFFSETPYDQQLIINKVNSWSKGNKFTNTLRSVGDVQMFDLSFNDKERLKVDFNHYPYRRLEKGKKIDGVDVDSLRDIATNKLQTIVSRTQVKDFVDLYFLLREFTLWDLIYGLEPKFGMRFDSILIGTACLKVEEFDYLPNMLIPLELKDLKDFFVDLAKKIGMKVTKNDL